MAKPGRSRTARTGGTDGATAGRDGVMWTPPAGVPVVPDPEPAAIRAFEKAMALLQRHDYPRALAAFEALQATFTTQAGLLDRARVYAALCRRELSRTGSPAPATIEERMTAATAALNDGDDDRAQSLIAQVLTDAPRHELGHYLMAVVHARRGEANSAVEALTRAIAVSPEVRAQARHDADFAALRNDDRFVQLMLDRPAGPGDRRGS